MGLSRLDNFLKSTRGTILYVDPSSLDSTDSIENQGNSLARPFKTIQRALAEASRFSYQRGLNNDRFNKTTILLYPGDHLVDNRPGWIPDGANNFRLRSGATSNNFAAWDLTTNFDLTTEDNALYKLNSVHGGIIIPRGTSIVGMDLRKTKVRPKYVPNPENDNIERSAIFRVTGGCYFWQFSILDADPNGICYKDYTTNIFVPNFSHHKLTAFEYADGVNNININDDFQIYSTDRTDLDMYYEKIGLCYGSSSGRAITPDYPSSGLDIQPVIDEYRIVGSRGDEIGISSIRSGDGVTSSTTITVTLNDIFLEANVDTPIQISGVGSSGYDGQYVVSEVLSANEIQYQVQNAPTNPLPGVVGATLNIAVDTVTSASPYIFNISLRSVFGMCGMLADGDKADGFKSMVVAQFTGISLQKDDNAFVRYDSVAGEYKDSTSIDNLHTDSLAVFKPTYQNFHIKAINNSFIQNVSIFAIGYAQHFVVESGGDMSITNSNSNFGAKSLIASGFRKNSFEKDDVGYVTHIIPPKEIETSQTSIEFVAVDVLKTVGVASTNRLYLYNQTNLDTPPQNVIDGYRVGAKENDQLFLEISQSGITTEYSARIVMPNTQFTSNEVSSEKTFVVGRSIAGINSIGASGGVASNVIVLTQPHNFINGESVRVISSNGHLPDGLSAESVYYAITSGTGISTTNHIKIAKTLNDAIQDSPITLNSKGGVLSVVSRVSDKTSGDIGHPIQYDVGQGNWYVNTSGFSTENSIYTTVISLGSTTLGEATPRTYIKRTSDTRNLIDTIYRLRYVIPKDSPITARPPLDGYVIQLSNNVIGTGTTEIQKYFSPTPATLSNSTELRNISLIANASWSSNVATIITELPHNLTVGSIVEIDNVKSENNPTGVGNSGFNGTHTVVGISSTKHFTYLLSSLTGPGAFINDTSARNSDLPYYKRKNLTDTYQIYRSQEIQPYIPNAQDGIYHLIVTNSSNSPTVSPFEDEKLFQPILNLYPQTNRDNPNSDPPAAVSFAAPSPIGDVIVNNPQNSISKETLEKSFVDFNIGIGITNIVSNSTGTEHTLYTTLDHGFAGITSVSIIDGGFGYGSGSAGNIYNARLVGIGTSTTGFNATSRITIDGSGIITGIQIMDGGSAYGIGNTLAVVGVATTTSHSQAVVQVTNISDDINKSLKVNGITDSDYTDYNGLYRITGISTGSIKQIQVSSASTVGSATTLGIGFVAASDAFVINTGKTFEVFSLSYDIVSGICTVTTAENHDFLVNNKVLVGGADDDFFNGEFIVKKVNNLTSFAVNVGIATAIPSTSGTIRCYHPGYASAGGDVTAQNENIGGRLVVNYAGITTSLSTAILSTDSDATPLQINNADLIGLKIGDFLKIDEEIFRIRSTVSGNSVLAFRGLFGTRRVDHPINTIINKINPLPIELRRNSILRASGHTFEYLGFGPGNYSTAFPERQDRTLSGKEELLSQSFKTNGGIANFTAMNDAGDFYTGNKKVNSSTGQEEVFDAPIPSVVGEEVGPINIGFDVLTPLEASISRSIRVEGGPDANLISEFDGPVIFNNKITSNSDRGIEANSLFLQGEATVSRKYTVGISTPTLAGNIGDLVFKSNPEGGKNAGWIYSSDNSWKQFGSISTDTASFNPVFNITRSNQFIGTFFGDGSGLTGVDSQWLTTPLGITTTNNVGIATTLPLANTALYVAGSTNIQGTLKVFEIVERATVSAGILTAQNPVGVATTTNINLANNNVYYYTSNAQGNWTINFRGDASTTLDSFLTTGESMTVAIMATQGSTAYYNSTVKIDDVTVTPRYYGGTQITSGNANSIDMYTYVIIKTAPSTFTVLYSQSQYA